MPAPSAAVHRKPVLHIRAHRLISPDLAQDGSGVGAGGPRGQAEEAGGPESASGKGSAADSPWFKLASWRALLDALDLPVGPAATCCMLRVPYAPTASSYLA